MDPVKNQDLVDLGDVSDVLGITKELSSKEAVACLELIFASFTEEETNSVVTGLI